MDIAKKGDAQQKYEVIDHSPKFGNNYYRVKGIDFDGQVSYSKVEVARIHTKGMLTVYPNPVKETLHIDLQIEKAGNVDVSIYNSLGQKVFFKRLENEQTGLIHQQINIKDLPAQMYILKVHTHFREYEQSFIKE